MKNNKGITLIALVITIIVLLILAGVSIAMLTGNNGILTQANEAKVWTELGSVDDSYKTYILGLQANNNGAQVDLNSLTDLLTKVSVGDSGYVYAIKDLSKLNLSMESGKGEIPSSVTSINDFNDVYVVDEKGNVAYILSDKVYGNVELTEGEKPTREDFFVFNEETGAITGIVENTTKDPNGVGYYYDDEGNQILSEKNIVIPSTINGVPVTKIADEAFCCALIESVVIPDTVVEIGSHSGYSKFNTGAFENCSNLKSVTIPDSVVSIGAYTFNNCSQLADIVIPKNDIKIGYKAFNNTGWYKNQPDGVVYFNDVVYTYKGNVPENEQIEIKDGIVGISEYAFSSCTGLTNVTIPSSVKSIGNYAFSSCTGLTNVTIPSSVKSIGNYVFSSCTGLTNITIPGSVTSIGKYAFYKCSALTNVTILNGVTSIGYEAFGECSTLESITIPSSVTSIEARAFCECAKLTTIVIPNGVTSIGYDTFEGCSSLTDITIPNTVTDIEGEAFVGCKALTNIFIPSSVTSLGFDVFIGWANSQTISIEAKSIPSGWDSRWNRGCKANIKLGQSRPIEQ